MNSSTNVREHKTPENVAETFNCVKIMEQECIFRPPKCDFDDNNDDDIADIVDIIRIRNLMPRIMTLIREPPRLQ